MIDFILNFVHLGFTIFVEAFTFAGEFVRDVLFYLGLWF